VFGEKEKKKEKLRPGAAAEVAIMEQDYACTLTQTRPKGIYPKEKGRHQKKVRTKKKRKKKTGGNVKGKTETQHKIKSVATRRWNVQIEHSDRG